MKFTGPLFIIGMPRSGTKLIRTLLNNHSSIYIPSIETNNIPLMIKLYREIGDIKDPKNFHRFYNTISKTTYFKYRKLDKKKIITESEWYNSCSNFTIGEVFKKLILFNIDCHQEDVDLIWGDKSPSYINHVHHLKEIFPQAKFIHIIRDVRDYCLSINKAWGKNMLRAAKRWTDDNFALKKAISDFTQDVLELKYENLIENPQQILNEICHFLSIPYEENMHNLKITSENLGEARGLTSIKRDNKNKYQQNIKAGELAKIEGIAYYCLLQYGYSVPATIKHQKVSKSRLLLYKILDGFNLLRFYMREGGVTFLVSLIRN